MADYHSRTEKRQAMQNKGKKNNTGKNGNVPAGGGGGNKKKSIFKRVLLILTLLFLFFILAGTITVFAIIKDSPALNPAALKDPVSTQILDKNNKAFTTVFQNEKRIYANINEIPDQVQQAFISTEDARFYKHFGIDPYRIGGAVVANLTHGFGSEGGSTITQQVIKNSYLSPKKTLTRKIQEAYLAIKLEQKYTKKQILEMYLNKIYLGESAYGVGTASKVYFGKKVENLSLAQSAMLAALPKAPSHYDPLDNPTDAKNRRNLVLDLMVKHKAITQAQADKAKAVPMDKMLKGHQKLAKSKSKYDAYVNYVYHELVQVKKVISKDEFYSGGLKIYTALDPKAQSRLEDVLNNDANFPGVKDNFEAGATIVDTQTGAIRAIGGGRNYQYGDLNWGTSPKANQVGSTAKPILDYGPAIDYLKWSTGHIVDDSKFSYSGGQEVGDWDGRYEGKMTIRKALAESRNIPAIKTLLDVQDQAGNDKEKAFTNKLGFNFKNIYPSYAIGSYSSSPLQMAGAYAAFGNQGVYNQPFAVEKIVYPEGNTKTFDHEQHAAMHDYTAYMVTDMLKSVMDRSAGGTGWRANISGVPLAGKTGTQNIDSKFAKKYHLTKDEVKHGASDSWFIGYTPKLTMSIWTGYVSPYDKKGNGTFLNSEESHMGQSAFKAVMSDLVSSNTSDWKKPDSVVSKAIEKDTGLLPSKSTPSDKIIHELFVKGQAPDKVSTKYKSEKLPSPTNLQANYDAASKSISLTWDYGSKKDVKFDISGDGISQTASDTKATLNNVKPGKDYTLTVTAKSSDPKYDPSDPATVKVKVPADNTNQGKDKNQQSKAKLPAPSGVAGQYNPDNRTLSLTWSYSGDQPATFDVSVNGSTQSTTTPTLTVNNIEAGKDYKVTIVAKPQDPSKGQPSDPTTTTVKIPKDKQQQPPANGTNSNNNSGNNNSGNNNSDNSSNSNSNSSTDNSNPGNNSPDKNKNKTPDKKPAN